MSDTWWHDENDLVDEQLALLGVPADKSVLIEGPPGSGKTNLLLLRANQLFIDQHPNLHVVVFGSLLKKFIKIGGAQYKFPEDKVVTHTHLFSTILRAEGCDIDSNKLSLDEARAKRCAEISKLLKVKKIGKLYDALLLDEAQDYSPTEIEIFLSITDVVIATADSKQKVYAVDDCMELLRARIDRKHRLKYHFRNGREICKVADGLMKGKPDYIKMLPSSHYNESAYPSKVHLKPGLSLSEQAVAMAAQIKDQQFAYPDDIIGVMCPRNEDLDVIADGLEAQGLGEFMTRANSNHFDPTCQLWLSTLTAAKGLEFRAAHIGGLENLSRMGGPQRRLIYTGVTRAKTTLSLYWNQTCPGYLQSATVPLETGQPPTIKRIFGKA